MIELRASSVAHLEAAQGEAKRWQERAERAEAEVERLKDLLTEVNRVNDARVKELEAEVERLKAALVESRLVEAHCCLARQARIDAALALHKRGMNPQNQLYCMECKRIGWPCPTVKALRAEGGK